MIVRICRTCKWFEPNEEEDREELRDSVRLEFSSSWCWHELSDGKTSTDDMILKGPCGRDLKLWERKEFRNE